MTLTFFLSHLSSERQADHPAPKEDFGLW